MGTKKNVIQEDGSNLNDEQKEFCRLYTQTQSRGNGVECYVEAYNIDLTEKGAYASAKSAASRLLTNVNLLSYMRSLYEDTDLNDTVVDNELAFIIKQNADFGSKLGGIKEYNALKKRIKEKENKHTVKINVIRR